MILAQFQQRIRHHGWRPLIIGLRCAVAAMTAVEVCRLFNFQSPIYALVAAILVTEYHGEETRKQSLTRFLGNALGIICGGILGTFLGGPPWVIGLAACVMVLGCYYFDFEAAAKLSAFVAALTVMDHSGSPWIYGRDRITETLIGIGFAVIASLVIRVPKAKARPNSEPSANE